MQLRAEDAGISEHGGARRRRCPLLAAAALLVLAAFAAPLLAGEKPRAECSLCGMWLDEYRHTRHVVALRDGSSHPFCSLPCAAKLLKQKGADVVSIRAADYGTTALVDARKAHYVLGGDVPPVMSATSTAAFGNRAGAEAFRKKHGGRLATFEQALAAGEP